MQIGDTVRVLSFGQNAELVGLSADRSEAEVQMGSMRFRVSVDNIERLSKRQASTQERTQSQPQWFYRVTRICRRSHHNLIFAAGVWSKLWMNWIVT